MFSSLVVSQFIYNITVHFSVCFVVRYLTKQSVKTYVTLREIIDGGIQLFHTPYRRSETVDNSDGCSVLVVVGECVGRG